MRKFLVVSMFLAAALPLSALAVDTSSGCGVGWQVTQSMTLLGTTTRGTTNTFLPNTFSMTTGSSGCAKHSIAKKDLDTVIYVASNFDPLTIQMAEGRGEYLDGLARSMGCSDGSREAFGTMTQKKFRDITGKGDGSAYDLFINVKEQIRANPALAASCNA